MTIGWPFGHPIICYLSYLFRIFIRIQVAAVTYIVAVAALDVNVGATVIVHSDGVDNRILVVIGGEGNLPLVLLPAAVNVLVDIILKSQHLSAAVRNVVRHSDVRQVGFYGSAVNRQ